MNFDAFMLVFSVHDDDSQEFRIEMNENNSF